MTEVYYDAIHHAREPLSMEAMILFMDELLSGYGVDPEATYIVDNRELYFVPCVNPDGYEYNFQTNPGGGGLWRKNRRDNGDGTVGVDLNRNYSTGWDAPNGGNSTDTSSSTYRGTAPFSEPETAAVEAFVASRDFVQVFSIHTYTDILLRPWSYQLGDPDNVSEYELVGDALTAENGNAHGGTAEVLYIAAGSALDHHHVLAVGGDVVVGSVEEASDVVAVEEELRDSGLTGVGVEVHCQEVTTAPEEELAAAPDRLGAALQRDRFPRPQGSLFRVSPHVDLGEALFVRDVGQPRAVR